MEQEDELDDEERLPRRHLSSSIANELLSLIPILLSSSRAPLILSPPPVDDIAVPPLSLGSAILNKISRYLNQLPAQAFIPFEILRSLNIVLAELELNAKDDFTLASIKLFPQLVTAWTSRSKGDLSIRESALVALRMMLPYVTHPTVVDQASKEAIRVAMGKLVDWIGKEAGSRGAIRSVDLKTLRLDSSSGIKSNDPFQLSGVVVS
jgi:ataxia telangiectasia mutated family protein